MARMLLVHGAAHGAWCWRDVIPALRALGHEAVAIDLPSHGADSATPETVGFDDYTDAVLAALAETPSVLVGHSMGGYPISAAADRRPDLVQRLIYVCAYLPQPGKSLVDMLRQASSQPLTPVIAVSEDRKTMVFDPDRSPPLLYHDCPPGTAEYAVPRLSRQPMAPQLARPALDGGFADVPKSYVLCRNDRAIPPDHQAAMSAGLDPADVYPFDSGHSPFFADPDGLAQLLDRIARRG